MTNSSGTLLETDGYDALGRRVTITTYAGGSPSTTDVYYSTSGQVLEEDKSGSVVSQTVYGPNYVNSVIEVDQTTGSPGTLNQRIYVQQDANYNVTSITDTSGTVLERYLYSPNGEQTVLNPDGTVKGDGTPASSCPVFAIHSDDLPDGLSIVQDSPKHLTMRPDQPVLEAKFQAQLGETRASWTLAPKS